MNQEKRVQIEKMICGIQSNIAFLHAEHSFLRFKKALELLSKAEDELWHWIEEEVKHS